VHQPSAFMPSGDYVRMCRSGTSGDPSNLNSSEAQ
jgi:hypothetical protein